MVSVLLILILMLTAGRCVSLMAAAAPAPPAASSGASTPAIETAAGMLRLRATSAPEITRLDLRVTCLYVDRAWSSVWLTDATGTFWTEGSGCPSSVRAGDVLSIRGRTRAGAADIDWSAAEVTVLDRDRLPEPQRLSPEQLGLKHGGDLWVELDGIVRRIHHRRGHIQVEFILGTRVCEITLPSSEPREDLVDCAEIRARGVLVPADRYTPPDVQLKLYVPTSGHLVLLASDHRRHFDEAITLESPASPAVPGDRVRIRGRVASQSPGVLVLKDTPLGDCSVHSAMVARVATDASIEAVGHLERNPDGSVALRHAWYRNALPRRTTSALAADGTSRRPADSAESVAPLQTLGEVRRLTRAEASRGLPVEVRTQVLADLTSQGWDVLFVQDSTGASYVRSGTNRWALAAGDWVMLEGRTEASGIGISVRDARVRRLGSGSLPAPLRTSIGHLQLATEDCRWVEIEGWVRQAKVRDHVLMLEICDGTGRLPVFVGSSDVPLGIRDALVRVRGAAGARTDDAQQFLGMTLFCPSDGELTLTMPAPLDPFDFPTTPISAVRTHAAQPFGLRRVKIEGVVTAQSDASSVFVQEGDVAVSVRLWEPATVPAGTRVEAVGIPTWHPPVLELKEARWRRLGSAPLPTALVVAGPEGFGPNHSSVRSTVEAVLASVSRVRDLLILDFAEPRNLDARCLDSPAARSLLELTPGSKLRLTGALECVRSDESHDASHEHRLFVGSADDVTVLARGPWWDRRHGYALIGVVGLALAGGLTWVRSLRRLVRFQTAEITHELLERRQVEEALRGSLREKDALLREIHHRVKNNLQIVSSLLNLQSLRVDNPRVREALSDTQGRVRSMALLHEALYRSGNLARLDVPSYVESLVSHLRRSMPDIANRVAFTLEIAPVHLDLDRAVPCGVIINELVTNSLKHAFPGVRPGAITVRLCPTEREGLSLRVADDGVGGVPADPGQRGCLGLLLVGDLVKQLAGTHRLDSASGRGTVFDMVFPQSPHRS